MARKKKAKPVGQQSMSLNDAAALLLQLGPSDQAELERLRDALERLSTELSGPPLVRAMVADAAKRLREVLEGKAAKPEAALEEAGSLIGDAMFVLDTGFGDGATDAGTAAADDAGKSAGSDHQSGASKDDAARTPALPADADIGLIESFVEESREYLEAAEAAMLLLEADPDDLEACNTVFRAFHTIKGTAAFLGLDEVSELAHWAESLLSRVRDREIRFTGECADLSLRAVDGLKAYIESVAGALAGAELVRPDGYGLLVQDLIDSESMLVDDASAATPAVRNDASPIQETDGSGAGDDEPVRQVPTDAAPGAALDAAEVRSRGLAQGTELWARVRTDRLDSLVDMIGELVIAHSIVAEDPILKDERSTELAKSIALSGKIIRELQDLSISMRMVPLRSTFRKMARLIRDMAQKQGKLVEFVTEAEDTEVDRNMVELINDPLVHMIRNAIDHGIEAPDAREAAGKPRAGKIRLSAYHAGGNVVIELKDDGRGLDREKILARAISRGLIDSDRGLSDGDIYNLIFAPGFSTAEQVTDVSGRGVGMDVVKRNVESIRGQIGIESEPGKGATFSLRLPLTLAITDGMLVRAGAERYIVPTISIQMSFRPAPDQLSTINGRGEVVLLRGELVPVVRLHKVLDIADAVTDPTEAILIIIGIGERRFALLVDELLGQHQVVAKSLGRGLSKVPGISGGAILGDGRVGLILDPAQLAALAGIGRTGDGVIRSVA